MDISDWLLIVFVVAFITSDVAQVKYNSAVTDLLLQHGKEIDLLRQSIVPEAGEEQP